MALGDGTTWDETEPTEATEASLAPVYINDDRVGTRKRMQNEHFWPASQTSVLQGGQHSYITLQAYNGFPGFIVNNSGTSLQVGGLWIDGSSNLWYSCTGTTGPTTVPFLLNGYTVLSATDTSPNFLGTKFTSGLAIIGTTAGVGSTGGTKIGVSGVLGAFSGLSGGQVYTALTDGFVIACGTTVASNAYLQGMVAGSQVIINGNGNANYGLLLSITFPVKLGQTWEVNYANLTGAPTVNFIPLGG